MATSIPKRRSRRLLGLAPEHAAIVPRRRRLSRRIPQPTAPASKKLDRFYFDSALQTPVVVSTKPCSYWVANVHCLLAFTIFRLLQRQVMGVDISSKVASSSWTERGVIVKERVAEGFGEVFFDAEEPELFFFDAVEEIKPTVQDDVFFDAEEPELFFFDAEEPELFFFDAEQPEPEPFFFDAEEPELFFFDADEPEPELFFFDAQELDEEIEQASHDEVVFDVVEEREPAIQTRSLATNQNWNESSINGCSCISALVVAWHLLSDSAFLPFEAVEDVIDRVCGPILRAIRGKLSLVGPAFLVPSDTHDHLVEMGLLPQQYFEGVMAGDVTDTVHMSDYLQILSVGEDGKGARRKAASTFFFRAHVISVTKVVSDSEVSYDVFDSLPGTCTHCADLDALRAHLQEYTAGDYSDLEPFPPAWMAQVNEDPRLFQGFVWHVK